MISHIYYMALFTMQIVSKQLFFPPSKQQNSEIMNCFPLANKRTVYYDSVFSIQNIYG